VLKGGFVTLKRAPAKIQPSTADANPNSLICRTLLSRRIWHASCICKPTTYAVAADFESILGSSKRRSPFGKFLPEAQTAKRHRELMLPHKSFGRPAK
jgi:hypothetical protein